MGCNDGEPAGEVCEGEEGDDDKGLAPDCREGLVAETERVAFGAVPARRRSVLATLDVGKSDTIGRDRLGKTIIDVSGVHAACDDVSGIKCEWVPTGNPSGMWSRHAFLCLYSTHRTAHPDSVCLLAFLEAEEGE